MIFKVSWNHNVTLYEFQEFLKQAFHSQQIYISFKTVRMSTIKFVCTIPSWLVEGLKQFAKCNRADLNSRGVLKVKIDNCEIRTEHVSS